MWASFLEWETSVHLGDLASIGGLIASLVGFAVTIYAAFSSRKAAFRAEAAATAAISRSRLFDELVDFSFAIVTLEEIRRFHRTKQWPLLPDRYAALRKALVTIKASSISLDTTQSSTIQSALATLQTIERAVERGLLTNPSDLDGVKFNNLLAKKADGLQATLTELKNKHARAG